jgi:hypothetical protein
MQCPEEAAQFRQLAVRVREARAERLQLFADVSTALTRDFADTPL